MAHHPQVTSSSVSSRSISLQYAPIISPNHTPSHETQTSYYPNHLSSLHHPLPLTRERHVSTNTTNYATTHTHSSTTNSSHRRSSLSYSYPNSMFDASKRVRSDSVSSNLDRNLLVGMAPSSAMVYDMSHSYGRLHNLSPSPTRSKFNQIASSSAPSTSNANNHVFSHSPTLSYPSSGLGPERHSRIYAHAAPARMYQDASTSASTTRLAPPVQSPIPIPRKPSSHAYAHSYTSTVSAASSPSYSSTSSGRSPPSTAPSSPGPQMPLNSERAPPSNHICIPQSTEPFKGPSSVSLRRYEPISFDLTRWVEGGVRVIDVEGGSQLGLGAAREMVRPNDRVFDVQGVCEREIKVHIRVPGFEPHTKRIKTQGTTRAGLATKLANIITEFAVMCDKEQQAEVKKGNVFQRPLWG